MVLVNNFEVKGRGTLYEVIAYGKTDIFLGVMDNNWKPLSMTMVSYNL